MIEIILGVIALYIALYIGFSMIAVTAYMVDKCHDLRIGEGKIHTTLFCLAFWVGIALTTWAAYGIGRVVMSWSPLIIEL